MTKRAFALKGFSEPKPKSTTADRPLGKPLTVVDLLRAAHRVGCGQQMQELAGWHRMVSRLAWQCSGCGAMVSGLDVYNCVDGHLLRCSHPDSNYQPGLHQPAMGDPFTAVLRTRDGFERRLIQPWPPREMVQIAAASDGMSQAWTYSEAATYAQSTVNVRRFRLDRPLKWSPVRGETEMLYVEVI